MIRIFVLIFLALFTYGQTMEVQGHRGSRGVLPENTLPAFQSAIEAGADTLELDILVSRDGVLIVHHDFFVDTELCTYLDGSPILSPSLIRSLSLSEIKQIDCGRKKNPEFPKQVPIPGTQIPTIQELLEHIQASSHPNAKKVRLNLEIKRDPRHPEFTIPPEECAKKLMDKIQQNGFSERVYYSSFDPQVLSAIRKLDPKAKLGFIFSEETLSEAEKIKPNEAMSVILVLASFLKVDILSPSHTLLKNEEDLRKWQALGLRIIPWTVNDPKRWAELIHMGVDGIISDYPSDLIQFLKGR